MALLALLIFSRKGNHPPPTSCRRSGRTSRSQGGHRRRGRPGWASRPRRERIQCGRWGKWQVVITARWRPSTTETSRSAGGDIQRPGVRCQRAGRASRSGIRSPPRTWWTSTTPSNTAPASPGTVRGLHRRPGRRSGGPRRDLLAEVPHPEQRGAVGGVAQPARDRGGLRRGRRGRRRRVRRAAGVSGGVGLQKEGGLIDGLVSAIRVMSAAISRP